MGSLTAAKSYTTVVWAEHGGNTMEKSEQVMDLGNGGFVTIKKREGYQVLEFTRQEDAAAFVAKNPIQAKLKDAVSVKHTSIEQEDGSWAKVTTKVWTVIFR